MRETTKGQWKERGVSDMMTERFADQQVQRSKVTQTLMILIKMGGG